MCIPVVYKTSSLELSEKVPSCAASNNFASVSLTVQPRSISGSSETVTAFNKYPTAFKRRIEACMAS